MVKMVNLYSKFVKQQNFTLYDTIQSKNNFYEKVDYFFIKGSN